jgi:Tfp pilus assembly protein FimT
VTETGKKGPALARRSAGEVQVDVPLNVDGSAGRGMMEVIVGILIVLVVGSIFVHVVKLGYAMYTLNSTTGDVAETLSRARQIAIKENRKVTVMFDVDKNTYGIDSNANGRLDAAESEDLPEGIELSESCAVVFMPSGTLPAKAKDPHILLSNTHKSRSVSVSSLGSVSVE